MNKMKSVEIKENRIGEKPTKVEETNEMKFKKSKRKRISLFVEKALRLFTITFAHN